MGPVTSGLGTAALAGAAKAPMAKTATPSAHPRWWVKTVRLCIVPSFVLGGSGTPASSSSSTCLFARSQHAQLSSGAAPVQSRSGGGSKGRRGLLRLRAPPAPAQSPLWGGSEEGGRPPSELLAYLLSRLYRPAPV